MSTAKTTIIIELEIEGDSDDAMAVADALLDNGVPQDSFNEHEVEDAGPLHVLTAVARFADVATPELKFANHHNEIERQIIVLLVEDCLAEGFSIGVFDGEELMLEDSRDEAAIFKAMSTTDEDTLLVRRPGTKSAIRLIYGNGCDVISDFGVSLDGHPVMKRAEALAERFR